MVNKNTVKIVEKLKKMYQKNGGRTIDFIKIEQNFYKVAKIEDLRYFYRNCRDEEGAIFNAQECIKFMLRKTDLFSRQIFNDANLDQKKEMLLKACKVKYGKYVLNMFNLCPKEFKKEEINLAKAILKTKYVKNAILKPEINPEIKNFLIIGSIKHFRMNDALDLLELDKKTKDFSLTKKQRKAFVYKVCKNKKIAYYSNYIFGRDILTENERDMLVCSLAKYAEPDQIQDTIKFFAEKLGSKNVDILRDSGNSKLEFKFYTRK